MNWYLKVIRDNYANFNGRARRQEYWMFMLFHIIIVFSLGLCSALLVAITEYSAYIAIIVGLYFLATFIPVLAVTVRRLHDTGKNGWFILIQFIPYVGGIIMLVFTVIAGELGANQYGPDPKSTIIDEIDDIGKPEID